MNIKMLKKSTLFLLFITISPLFSLQVSNPTMFTIPVQFPAVLKTMPTLCMYYCGNRIKPDDYNAKNKILFSILENRLCTRFWLVITDTVPQWEIITENTIDHLKIDPSHNYKFYSLSLVMQEGAYAWNIQEVAIPATGKLPDNTLILAYNPDFVDRLEGGNAIELPTIIIKQDIVDIAGSQELLHEQSIELLLSSLDYNALHANIEQDIRHDKHTKIVRTIVT